MIKLIYVYQGKWSCVSSQENEKDAWHISVLFTGTVKLLNSAFYISKTAKWTVLKDFQIRVTLITLMNW